MIEVRAAKLDDLPFIYSTWLRSYRHSSQFAKKITNEIFYDMHHRVIDSFITRGGTVLIAHAKGEPDVILGYLCMESVGSILQYIYVKEAFRKMGIGKALFEYSKLPEDTTFTHWTNSTNWITKKLTKLNYNPYLL